MRRFLKFFILALLISCHRGNLYVQQQWVDRNFLASSHVGTPDPRQEHPPAGQRLLMSWSFPQAWFDQELTLVATVRFWNNTEQILNQPVNRKRGSAALYFPFRDKALRILTYRVQVISKDGCILETWNHHFWTELIDVHLDDPKHYVAKHNVV